MTNQALSYPPAPQLPTTIGDLEQVIAKALEELRPAPLSQSITAAFPYLLPAGLKVRVQLEEDGRKKRNTAAASNWNPESGEIVIYFEREDDQPQPTAPAIENAAPVSQAESRFGKYNRDVQAGLREDPIRVPASERRENTSFDIQVTLAEQNVSDVEIEQLCAALADAEKAGKSFIALKWFRDNELTTYNYPWVESLTHRQAVLRKALEANAIETTPIPNPKAPQHPTTTIKLNRESKYARSIPPRFQPIQLRGEGPTGSEIILRDRGRL
jgi:hypothetical protein